VTPAPSPSGGRPDGVDFEPPSPPGEDGAAEGEEEQADGDALPPRQRRHVVQAEADDEAVGTTDGNEEEGGSEDSGRPQLVCAVHGPARRCRCPGTGREFSGEAEVVVASDEEGGRGTRKSWTSRYRTR